MIYSHRRYRCSFITENETIMTVQEYAKKHILSEQTVRYQCRTRKLRSYTYKNQWYIIVKK